MTTPQPAALPDLTAVIAWLENGCDPSEAVKELKHYQSKLRALAALQAQPAADVSSGHIKEPYTLAELNARIASNDYNAELLLQHAMLLLNAQPAAAGVSDAEWWHEVLGSAGPDLLGLAKKWDSNEVHVYQFVNEAEKIVKAAAQRAILALRPQAVPMTDEQALGYWKIAARASSRYSPAEAYYRGIADAEAHHGITAQAGGEGKA